MTCTAPCATWRPTRRSASGGVTQMSQNDCAVMILYCATAYVITAAQRDLLALEGSGLTGVRNQDSQTSARFFPRGP